MAKWYTTKEVAEIVDVSKTTLYEWFRKRKIPEVARDRNNARAFSEDDVKRILAFKNKRVYPENGEVLSRQWGQNA
ncbi:MAG: helix-turn-helix domain-containing protein [Candidatus Omnitrophica bacterium]|nr:helix-turn-helix domain-containing protein [Candidatus Omnitrophota bacterium]